jgi:uncharacterized protein YjaZ
MKPKLRFISKGSKAVHQTKNLESWWNKHEDKVLRLMSYYVKCRWNVGCIDVYVHSLSKKGSRKTPHECRGEVYTSQPRKLHIFIGTRVRWTKSNLSVFIHELIHCATHSHKDKRFSKPGLLEYWILDELATDLLAQHILKEAIDAKQITRSSIEYALDDTADLILKGKDTREKLIKNVEKTLRQYLKTERKKYYSFRKSLGNI